MRIAIITQPLRYNYGGLLQNYALQTVLKQAGHFVVTLDTEVRTKKNFKYYIQAIIRFAIVHLRNHDNKILGQWKYCFTSELLAANTSRFIKDHIEVKKYSTPQESEYDALIVGSDQVWRPMYSDLKIAFLDFAKTWKKVKRLSYAASFGSDKWEFNEDEKETCSHLASLFDGISVREETGIKLCKDYLNIKATHVLDPTMLLTKNDYVDGLHIKDQEKSAGKLFYYLLDESPEKMAFVEKAVGILGKSKFTVNSKVENPNAPIAQRIQPPVEQWLRAFYDAEFIITDSFHGCVFSLIFNKPFIVFGNEKRGNARFHSLLKLFDQEHRLCSISTIDSIKLKDFSQKPAPDFTPIRKVSIEFLKEHLR